MQEISTSLQYLDFGSKDDMRSCTNSSFSVSIPGSLLVSVGLVEAAYCRAALCSE